MEAREPIIVIGAGGHARAVLDVLRCEARFRVVGLIDSTRPLGEALLGARVEGREEDLSAVCRTLGTRQALVAIGDNWQRRATMERLVQRVPELRFVSARHPSATVADDVTVGPGAVIMPGAVVVSGSTLGAGCIVNTLASLDHDGVLDAHASLAPGAIAGGRVRVGACAAVGLGARIVHGASIGAHTVIGAGALVLADVPEQVVAYGVPARVVRARALDEPYL